MTYRYEDSTWGDLLTEYNGKAVTSDAIGNMTGYDGQSWTWKGRQLASYTKASGEKTSYTYNADGIRTKKTTGNRTTEFFLNGDQILMMKTTTGTGSSATEGIIWFFYDSQGQRVGLCRNGTYMYYLYNLQGDVMAIASAGTGQIVATYKYDTWGNCEVDEFSTYAIGELNPFRYRGYYWDEESKLYYLNSRYYSPELCRFISADTTDVLEVQDNLYDKNLFSYCDNNPVMRRDAGGKVWLPLAYGVVGGVIGCAEAILATAMTKGSRKEIIVAGIVGGISGALTAVIPSSKMAIDIGAGIAEEVVLQFLGENSSSDTAVGIAVSTGTAFAGRESYLTVETGQRYSAALSKTKEGNHPKVKKEAKRIVKATRKNVRNEVIGGTIGATIGNALTKFLQKLF